jgi:hypothetical protein
VVVLHERYLRRLLTEYFHYDHHWRTHRGLAMDCPVPRPAFRLMVATGFRDPQG